MADVRYRAAMAHAELVLTSAERQLDFIVQRMTEMRERDRDDSRLDQWVPLVFALKELGVTSDALYHFLAAAILRAFRRPESDD